MGAAMNSCMIFIIRVTFQSLIADDEDDDFYLFKKYNILKMFGFALVFWLDALLANANIKF